MRARSKTLDFVCLLDSLPFIVKRVEQIFLRCSESLGYSSGLEQRRNRTRVKSKLGENANPLSCRLQPSWISPCLLSVLFISSTESLGSRIKELQVGHKPALSSNK